MKIVISAAGRDKESNIDPTFGRARFFLIVDTKSKEVKVIENKAIDRPNGVGITAVNTVEKEGIDAVITAEIGPLAFETFEQSGVKVYKAEGRINDAIQHFKEGKLSEITKATRPKYAGLKQKKNVT
jgi:predicted Fe-Mo cluster-binding NifX family protein